MILQAVFLHGENKRAAGAARKAVPCEQRLLLQELCGSCILSSHYNVILRCYLAMIFLIKNTVSISPPQEQIPRQAPQKAATSSKPKQAAVGHKRDG